MHAAKEIPPGFEPYVQHSPLTRPWEPLYAKRTAEAFVIGLFLAEPHTNRRGLAHGGLIAALADAAMGYSCMQQQPEPGRGLTVGLSVDFLGTAAIGQWLEFTTTFVKTGTTLAFAQCFITADGVPGARANATFRVVG